MGPEEYSQTLASIRHYGNIRFALLTLYATITAGLFFAVFGKNIDAALAWQKNAPKILGIISSVTFFLFEIQINSYIVKLGQHIGEHYPGSHFLKLPDHNSNHVSYSVRFMIALIGIFWFLCLLN